MNNYVKTQELCNAFGIKTTDFLNMLVEHDAVRKDDDIKGYIPTLLGQHELGLMMKFNEEHQRASVLFDIDNRNLNNYIKAFKSKESHFRRESLVEYLKSSGVNLDSKKIKIRGVNYLQSPEQTLLQILENIGLVDIDEEGDDYLVKDVATENWGIYKNTNTETNEIWIKFKDKSFSRMFKDIYAGKVSSHDVERIDKVFMKHYFHRLDNRAKSFVLDNRDNYLYVYKLLCSSGVITRAYVDNYLVFRKEEDARKNFGGYIDDDGLHFDYRIYKELMSVIKEISQ